MTEASPDFTLRWIDDGAIFTIDRADKLNALTKPVLDGLADCLDRMERDDRRLLVICGDGARAFCAGTDLAEMQAMAMDVRLDKSAMARALFVRLSRSPIISVAAINGLALGGGLELAMACTLRIAAAHATFGLPEVVLGLLPAYGGTQLLPAIVGRAHAEELMLTGRTIAIDEALRIGLVHRRAIGGEDLLVEAIAFGREITGQDKVAVAAIRACLDAAGATLTDEGLEIEDRHVRAVFAGPGAAEGVAAFLARRRSR